jgi:hypothetical protein
MRPAARLHLVNPERQQHQPLRSDLPGRPLLWDLLDLQDLGHLPNPRRPSGLPGPPDLARLPNPRRPSDLLGPPDLAHPLAPLDLEHLPSLLRLSRLPPRRHRCRPWALPDPVALGAPLALVVLADLAARTFRPRHRRGCHHLTGPSF